MELAMLEEKAKTEPRYNRTIIECYRYLGYYYLVTEDYEKSKEYCSFFWKRDIMKAI